MSAGESATFWGYRLDIERGNRFPRALRCDWWVHVWDGNANDPLFSLRLEMRRLWRDAETDESRELHVRNRATALARGLIEANGYHQGELIERIVPGDDAHQQSEPNERHLEVEILRALRRMNRRQTGRSEVLTLDVIGLALALEVAPIRLQAVLRELITLGEATAYEPTLTQSGDQGAARLTDEGLKRLRLLDEQSAEHATVGINGRWNQLEARARDALTEVGLGEYVEQIESNLAAMTTAGDRAALYGCRSLLDALATYLWRDPRPTYSKLPGKGDDGHLQVTQDRWVNRLGAFINERVSGERAATLMGAELERIWQSIDALSDLASKAHDVSVEREDAELATVTTYTLLVELARRTELRPVDAYE